MRTCTVNIKQRPHVAATHLVLTNQQDIRLTLNPNFFSCRHVDTQLTTIPDMPPLRIADAAAGSTKALLLVVVPVPVPVPVLVLIPSSQLDVAPMLPMPSPPLLRAGSAC